MYIYLHVYIHTYIHIHRSIFYNYILYYIIGKLLITQMIGLAAPPNRPPHWSYGPPLSPICMVAIVMRLGAYSVTGTSASSSTGISSGGGIRSNYSYY